MKKSIIALAAIGAASIATAQSSVTLYGVADAGIGKIERGQPTGNDANGKVQFMSASRMNNGTSRVGVRGVEDLGGGLKAGFHFETGIDLDQGDAITSGGALWGRQAYMWVESNFGTLKLGRTLNPSFWGVAAWELTGAANYSVTGNTFGYHGVRNSSQFAYKSPSFGGLTTELAYVTKSDHGGRARVDGNVIYRGGPVIVGLSINKTKGYKTNWSLGGRYTFGNFKVAAGYHQHAAPGTQLKRNGYTVGVGAQFGAFSGSLDIARDTKNQVAGKKYTNVVAEGRYALSKRTFVYAAYGRFDRTNNYGIGVRHNF